jgi:hypothetical protein
MNIRTLTLLSFVTSLALMFGVDQVAAQPGPAPGYDDPAAYAVDHVQDEANATVADPVGHAGSKASQQGVDNGTRHAAWLACWSADRYADANPADACDAYYTPAEAAAPDQPVDDDVADPGDGQVKDVTNDAQELVSEVTDAVDDAVEDPGSAPQQVVRIVEAALGFLSKAADSVAGAAMELVGTAGQALGEAVATAEDAAGAALDLVGAAEEAVGEGAGLAGDALDAGQDAADRAGDAVGDAVEAIDAFVERLLGGDRGPPEDEPLETPDAEDLPVDDGGLLGDVDRLLEDTV